MGNLFGIKRRAPEITAQDRAVLQLKQQRDKIKIYQRKVESNLESNKQLALQLFQNGMKDRALIVLRRKKCMEDVLTRTDKQLETLESLVQDIEYTQIEVSVVEGLRVGTEALKQLNNLMNIEDIQQIMEDNAEAAEKQREISAILQQTTGERYDEQDLLNELERYKKQAEPEPSSKVEDSEKSVEPEREENAISIPSSPTAIPASNEDAAASPIMEVSQVAEEEAEQKQAEKIDQDIDNLPEVPVHEDKDIIVENETAESTSPQRRTKAKQRKERQLETA